MPTDRYGLALSTASSEARDAYVEGAELVLTLYPGAAAARPAPHSGGRSRGGVAALGYQCRTGPTSTWMKCARG